MPALSPYFRRKLGKLKHPMLWDGCIGAWCPSVMGPNGGTLYDLSGFNCHGTLTNMDPGSDYVVSGGKYALDFDGSNDYVDVGKGTHFSPSRLSVSFWMKFNANPAEFDAVIANADTPTDNWTRGWGFIITNSPSGALQFFVESWNVNAANASVSLTTWRHICGTWDGTTISIYVDGVLAGTDTYSGSMTAGQGLFLGRISSNTYNINGQIDDVLIHNRALTPSAVRLLASGRGRAYETLLPPVYPPPASNLLDARRRAVVC